MLIVPASTACVAGVALGLSKDLLQRAASVTLKERRPLVVAVRETPLSGQTLRQLVALDDAGAVVLPASPAFYAGASPPRTWWTSSPAGCWTRPASRTGSTGGGRSGGTPGRRRRAGAAGAGPVRRRTGAGADVALRRCAEHGV